VAYFCLIMNKIRQKIKITSAENVWTAVMEDNPTTKDFLSLLPLALTLEDYNRTEKISGLPKTLSLDNAPTGYKPAAGDITIYAPCGNLAIFYKGFSYSSGLVFLGKIELNVEALSLPGDIEVTIELMSS
jgi:hypothetical protein